LSIMPFGLAGGDHITSMLFGVIFLYERLRGSEGTETVEE